MNQVANTANPVNETKSVVREAYDIQRAAYLKNPYPEYQERLKNLQKLERILVENRDAIAEAIDKDYNGRSHYESKLLEVFGAVDGLRYSSKNLKKWMKTSKRHASVWFFGAKNKVIPQPKGVVGIVVPWNYPLFLGMSPIATALSAGNRVMVKMAANSQNLCNLLNDLISKEFSPETLKFLPGVSAREFTDIPYDHIIFTGSAPVGKQVMAKASEFLTPVTLELGGKSPTIIADDYDVKEACSRILRGKMYNAGQTCVSPDYLFVPESKLELFVEEAKKIIAKRYPNIDSQDYTTIVDARAYKRLIDTLDDAKAKGAKLVNLMGNAKPNDERQKIPATLVLNPTTDMTILQEEIFGPLLPIITYKHIDEVFAYISERDRPLGLYLFSNDKKLQEHTIMNTISGGVCLNDVLLQVAQHDMPFGGSGYSGMGHYHGYEGFAELSKLRPVFQQAKVPSTKFLTAPYGKIADLMERSMIGGKKK